MSPDPAELRHRTERWFIHKGLPHLIEGYQATTGVMTRMIPGLVILFFLETNLVFGDRFSGWAQAAVWCGSAGVIATVSALQFAVASLNDVTYREQFFNDVAGEIRSVLAVRAVYRHHLVT